jgi:hypothetical protein
MTLDFYVDGVLSHTADVPVGIEREVILPEGEAKHFRYVLRGMGTAADTEIRELSRGRPG